MGKQPILANENEKDSRLTHLLFDFISEVAASIDIPDVQKYPVVAESALQLGREMIRRPASVGPAIVDKDNALLRLRQFSHFALLPER